MNDFSHLETHEGDIEGFKRPETTSVSILSIIASNDTVLDKRHEDYVEGAEAGSFFVRTSNMVLSVPLRTIPLVYKQLYTEFKKNMGEFIGTITVEEARNRAVDPYKFGQLTTRQGTVLQETYSFIVVLPDYQNMLARINFMSSRVPDGSAWFRRVTNMEYEGKKIVPWNQVYTVSTMLKRDTKNAWYLIKPVFDSFIGVEEHKMVTDLRASFGSLEQLMIASNTSEDKAPDHNDY